MKRNILRYTLSVLVCVLLLSGCEQVIKVDIDKKSGQLVVDAFISDQNNKGLCIVNLTRTTDYFDENQAPKVSGAVITLKDDKGNQEILIENPIGTYQSVKIKGVLNTSYTLEIFVDGESYSASTKINPVPDIDSLTYKKEDESADRKAGFYVKYFGSELPEEGNYYRAKIYQNGKLLNKPEELSVVSDEFTNGNYLNDLQLNANPLKLKDTIKVEILGITRESYDFYTELRQQTTNQGLFSTPAANVRTNIINNKRNSSKNAVGFFVGAGIKSKEGIILSGKGVIK